MNRFCWSAWAGCCLTMGVITGCGESRSDVPAPPIPTAPATPQSGTTQTDDAAGTVLTEAKERSFEGITVTIPAGWEERAPASEFIQAEYRLNGPGGTARLTMSSAGG